MTDFQQDQTPFMSNPSTNASWQATDGPAEAAPKQLSDGQAIPQPGLHEQAASYRPSYRRVLPQQPPYGQAPPQQPPYGQAPPQQQPFGQAPPQQQPYGQAPPQQPPYGQAPPQQSPYGQVPPQQPPFVQAPPQQPPFGQAPPQQPPFGQAPPQHPPYGQAPPQQPPYGQPRYASSSYGTPTPPPFGPGGPQLHFSSDAYCDLTKHILLMIFTFGVWFCIWIYRMTRELNNVPGEPYRDPTNKLLLCIFVPFYWIYWIYISAQRIDMLLAMYRVPVSITTLCLVMCFILSVVSPIIMQDKMNQIVNLSAPMPAQQPYQW